jgi:hypothetical protein
VMGDGRARGRGRRCDFERAAVFLSSNPALHITIAAKVDTDAASACGSA